MEWTSKRSGGAYGLRFHTIVCYCQQIEKIPFYFMTKNDIQSMDKEIVSPVYLNMSQYAANQCTGCSDSPMILAFKAQQVMLEAHEKSENPIERLNSFLGTSIPEDVILSIIDE